jgi:glycosyltransferase involved in cell wall biosynthesis
MRPAKFRVAYVGMISFWKGIHYLLEAWEQLALPNAELLLCGTPEKAFKEKFGRFWHTPSIRFLGHVDPLPFLQQSSVFCFPSLSEGCPQAIIEAMACGLPVIATENSGSLARNGKEGFVVPIRDSGALAAKIRFFYENPRPARQMGAAAARRAKEFSIERYSERFAGSIEDAYVKLGRREKIGR